MKRSTCTLISVFLLLVMALSVAACSGSGSEKNTVRAEAEDFRYTLSADALHYEAADLDPAKPFDVTLSIEYVGDQNTIDVWCVDDLGNISMENANGKPMLPEEHYSRATSRVTLKKGTPYEISWTGAEEYQEYDGIPAGDYKVVAYLNFATDANYDSIQENTLTLDLDIK